MNFFDIADRRMQVILGLIWKGQIPSLDRRRQECQRVIAKYPDRIPILVCRDPSERQLPAIDKSKYLVPRDLTCGQFQYVIRRRIHLGENQALFLYYGGNVFPASSALISTIYQDHHGDDGFLYASYCSENTFGRRKMSGSCDQTQIS